MALPDVAAGAVALSGGRDEFVIVMKKTHTASQSVTQSQMSRLSAM